MGKYEEVFMDMVRLCLRDIPGFVIREKDKCRSQRILGFILRWIIPINRTYMTTTTTTLYPVVYFPSSTWIANDYLRAFETLAHEYVHLCDEKRMGIRYKLKYLFPEVLSALSLLSLFALLWSPMILFLAALVFLIPWGSDSRARLEMRGYIMNLAISQWRKGRVDQVEVQEAVDNLTSGTYYWAGRSKELLFKMFYEGIGAAKTSTIFLMEDARPYERVHQLLKDRGILHEENTHAGNTGAN